MSWSRRRIARLAASLAIPQAVGLLAGAVTQPAVRDWYPTLVHPSIAPPAWVFGPVWTLLYLMMGIALFLVWDIGREHPDVRRALAAFSVQLGLNGLWSLLFFGMRGPLIAFLEILVLWVAIILTMMRCWRVRRTAGALLVPYWLWVTFAAVLNLEYWRLN